MLRLLKQKTKIRALALLMTGAVGVWFLAAPVALADVMTSSSFRIPADTISIGGGRSTSGSFIIEDTLGEMATGEDLSSASFKGCVGYQCFIQSAYISFNLTAGTSRPGTVGADVALGTLTTSSVKSSDNATINSIFVDAAANAVGGFGVTVKGSQTGLRSTSNSYTIPSATATLTAGTEGFGVCIASVDQGDYSPNTLDKVAPYDGSCSPANHDVGIVDTSTRTILSSDGQLSGGQAEILVKAAISTTSAAASDYTDSLTFIMTATY
jgi:hypothetical protein